jgi:hypothetical protein
MSGTVPAAIGAVAHYNLLERLDPAGPGDLYRARDTKLGRHRRHPPAAPRFRQRASGPRGSPGAGTRAHLDVASERDDAVRCRRARRPLYLAFEFLKGQSLRAEMAGRPMNIRRRGGARRPGGRRRR